MSVMQQKNPRLVNNLLSRLPEELIHRILGLLTTKDAIKASFASKPLQSAWLSSCPCLDFRQQDFLATKKPVNDQELRCYHNYVSNTMARMIRNNTVTRITSFKFETIWYDLTRSPPPPPLLDKWIGIALDCRVYEICLTFQHHKGVQYLLPQRVLSSSFLKSLVLVCKLGSELSLLGSGGAVNIIKLPCLQSLTLIRVSIDEHALKGLLKRCPSLEYLKITPHIELLSQLNISHLKLKSLNVSNRDFHRIKTLDKVEVDAPCLEEFSYSDSSCLQDKTDFILKSSTLKNLKCLSLFLYKRISMEWLSKLLPNCTSLETLRIELWYYHMETKAIFMLSNPHVKNIVINYGSVAKFEIDCPMLQSLRWTAYVADGSLRHESRLLPTLSMINHQLPDPNFAGHLHMDYCPYTYLNKEWFHKLSEFLSKSRIVAMSWLCRLYSYSKELGDHQNGDIESLPSSAVDIGLLCLMVSSGLHESCYTFIMNGFLSTCRPRTIHLATIHDPVETGKESIHFIEFFRKKLENWKDGDGCYCSSKIKCWKHQLKSVEIQEFRKLEDKFERDHYDFGILPVPPSFRLKFQWY